MKIPKNPQSFSEIIPIRREYNVETYHYEARKDLKKNFRKMISRKSTKSDDFP